MKVYKCKCHKKVARYSNPSGKGLGTWRCPVNGQKAPVSVEIKDEK